MSVRVFCALAALALAAPARALLEEAVDVIKLGAEVGLEVLNTWEVLGPPTNTSGGVPLPIIKRREKEVLARMDLVSRAIERIEAKVEVASMAILLTKKVRGTGLELKLHEISDLIGRIANADRDVREYMRYQQELERTTLQHFAEWCVTPDRGGLAGLLERVHSLIVPPHHGLLSRGIMQLVVRELEQEDPDLCEMQLSPHQLIYDMYNTISLTEIKGYAMMQFSWMLLRIYGKGNFTQEASLTRQRYGERTAQTASAARAALAMARRDLYRCDPQQHKEGETYDQVTKLLQGYIENEVDMNKDGTCRDNCAYYNLAENHGCFKDQYCSKQASCKGRILDCRYVDSDMWICPAGGKSNRRYEWIQYENGRTMGKVGTCTRGTTKVDSWWRWTVHCSYCMCLCEDQVNVTERFFSLRQEMSDIARNKVVTGLRLVKLGRVFHLQISEGVLGERGVVGPSTWVPVQKFDPHDHGVAEGVDFHTMTYERRAVDLDELDAPVGSVLTGVRFQMLGAHLHFEIRSTPFNYTTGRLAHERVEWHSNDNTDGTETPRSRLTLEHPDIPTRSMSPLPVDSKHDQYVEFTHTDFDADAAQSTVPFVDIQPVQPLKGLVSGAGIVHRGARGSGGYIAPKLLTYDYSRHVNAELPPPSFDEDTTEFAAVVN